MNKINRKLIFNHPELGEHTHKIFCYYNFLLNQSTDNIISSGIYFVMQEEGMTF